MCYFQKKQQKKKNDKSSNRFVSAPNLSAVETSGMGNGHPTRLEPIPNSPIHDIEFNSSKPLPQPVLPKEAKTFLRWALPRQSNCRGHESAGLLI